MSKTPGSFLPKNSPLDDIISWANSSEGKQFQKRAMDLAKSGMSSAGNALQQAWNGISEWASPPPISPIPEKTAGRLFEPGGPKQLVNNIVAMASGRPELVRNFKTIQQLQADAMKSPVPSELLTRGVMPSANVQPVVNQPVKVVTPSPTPRKISQPLTAEVSSFSLTPTPTQTVAQQQVPQITPYPKPTYSQSQNQYKNRLITDANKLGVNSDVLVGIGNNESSMNPSAKPNINAREESYGPFQINFKIVDSDGNVTVLKDRGGLTREDAQDYNKAVVWVAKKLKQGQDYFPDSIDRQILFYNVPGNVFRTRAEGGGLRPANEISQQAAWYLANALKAIGRTPSAEYLPVLQKYGFFK